MWLRHFHHKHKQKRFKAFKARYLEYRASDTSRICTHHHEEISIINGKEIARFMRKKNFRRCREWTWEEADELMAHLRKVHARWIKMDTPGLLPKRIKS